jgi:hypothetical protein
MEQWHMPEPSSVDPDRMLPHDRHDLVADGQKPIEVILSDDLQVCLDLILREFR